MKNEYPFTVFANIKKALLQKFFGHLIYFKFSLKLYVTRKRNTIIKIYIYSYKTVSKRTNIKMG